MKLLMGQQIFFHENIHNYIFRLATTLHMYNIQTIAMRKGKYDTIKTKFDSNIHALGYLLIAKNTVRFGFVKMHPKYSIFWKR